MGGTCSREALTPESPLTVSVEVTPVVSRQLGGSIKCTVVTRFQPAEITWMKDGVSALLNLSSDRTTATGVECGTYVIQVRDRSGDTRRVEARVALADIPRVVSYEVKHASCDSSRDGQITAKLEGVERDRPLMYLWTNSLTTESPVLHDVRPGMYAVALCCQTTNLAYIHECGPAVVRVRDAR